MVDHEMVISVELSEVALTPVGADGADEPPPPPPPPQADTKIVKNNMTMNFIVFMIFPLLF
jgi:hypothetical protein